MKVTKKIHRNKTTVDDGMIPMINIVFLMLIFFMVAGHIDKSEPVKVKLPSSISEARKTANAITIVVSSKGDIAFNRKLIQQEKLADLILNKFQQSKDKQAFNLLIKVDQNLPIEKLRGVLSIIKKTGIKRVALATQETKEESQP